MSKTMYVPLPAFSAPPMQPVSFAPPISKAPTASADFACGIDIGTKNMCISFINNQGVVSYHGAPTAMTRYEIGKPNTQIYAIDATSPHHGFISLLNQIPEFRNTMRAIIEKQVAHNTAVMHFLEGMIFTYLVCSHKHITTTIAGSTIRKGFLEKRIGRGLIGCAEPEIMSAKATKKLSLGYVFLFYPQVWQSIKPLGKLDDICDSMVYADLANSKCDHEEPMKLASPQDYGFDD